MILCFILRYQDEDRQKTATYFFRKVQEAYQVLSDDRLRAVYDLKGKKGVIDDRAVIERTALPTELMDEYEKLKSLFEERTYIQDVNPTGLFEMRLDASPLLSRQPVNRNWITFISAYAQQSVDAQMTKSSSFHVDSMVYAHKNGFSSAVQLGVKQQLEKQNWVKVKAAIGVPNTFGIDFYHQLTNRMYITSHNFLQLHPGFFVVSLNGNLACKLDDRSTLVYKIKNNGSNMGVAINRKVSEKVEINSEVMVGYDSAHIEVSGKYHPKVEYGLIGSLQMSTKGPSISYGVEHTIAKLTNVGAQVSISNSGVLLQLSYTRASMSFMCKLLLSPYPSIPAVLLATVSPAVLFVCLKVLALAPILRRQRIQEMEELKLERQREMARRKIEAESAVELMRETVERVLAVERCRQGLIINEAWYGCLFSTHPCDPLALPKVIDVTIPLQCLVSDSKLILWESSKSMVPGFYDPCIGEKKYLRVRYEFRGDIHEVTIENSEPLVIPRQSHRLLPMI